MNAFRSLEERIREAELEIRRLRNQLAATHSGTKLIASSITGVVPPGHGGTGTSTPSGGQTKRGYVPFGSEAEGGHSFLPSGAGTLYTQLGDVRRLINPAVDFPGLNHFVLEVILRTATAGREAAARLYDIAAGKVVSGSQVATLSQSPVRVRSGAFTLPNADREYRVEFGGPAGGIYTAYDAAAIAGDATLFGSDMEVLDMANEIMNFTSLERADDAQPEWWEESAAQATLTEVDVAGEAGVTESYERALKLVTTADVYAYQRYIYADQPRLKPGQAVSVRVAVWAAGGATTRVRLQSSVGSLAVAMTTQAAWTILELTGIVLDGSQVELRLEVNNGTAYFVPLGFLVSSQAASLRPRGLAFRHRDPVLTLNLAGQADPNVWTDEDVTGDTSPLAARVLCRYRFREPDAATTYLFDVRRNGSAKALATDEALVVVGEGSAVAELRGQFEASLDDQQIFEYILDRTAGASNLDVGSVYVEGWWEWE